MQKAAILIILGALVVVALIYYAFDGAPVRIQAGAEDVDIVQKWELPDELEEVSGIAYLDENRLACVQDEEGIIFIYNIQNSEIEREIHFGGTGDYEGLTLAGSTAYVLRSDGIIFEVPDFQENNPQTVKHTTSLEGKYDFEGLAYDENSNRLLLAVKDDPSDEYKPLYEFSLSSKVLNDEPVYKISLKDTVFERLDRKINHRILRPSEIGIHPVSGKLYVLEGVNPKLLILDAAGGIEKMYVFQPEQFNQAEGLTFSPEGRIFISNEGGPTPPNILEVSLDE